MNLSIKNVQVAWNIKWLEIVEIPITLIKGFTGFSFYFYCSPQSRALKWAVPLRVWLASAWQKAGIFEESFYLISLDICYNLLIMLIMLIMSIMLITILLINYILT